MSKTRTKQIDGHTVLDNESGTQFYHRALARKARLKKKAKRQSRRAAKRNNRR